MVKMWRDRMASKFLCKCIWGQGLLLGMDNSQECLRPAIRLPKCNCSSNFQEQGGWGWWEEWNPTPCF